MKRRRHLPWLTLAGVLLLAACAPRPGTSYRRPCTAWAWIEDCAWAFRPERNVLEGIAPRYELFLETDGTYAKYRRDQLVDWGWFDIICARTGNCGQDTIRFDSEEGIDWRLTMDDLSCDEPVRVVSPPRFPRPQPAPPVVLPGDFTRDPLPNQVDTERVRTKVPPRNIRKKEEPRPAEPDTASHTKPVKKPPVRKGTGR